MRRFLSKEMLILVVLLFGMNLVNGGFSNPLDWLMDKLIMLPAIIIGLSFHEFAHGAMSHLLGDPTPKAQGRLTINPAAHIDPFGFLALMVAGFGWGVPVQIDPRYYKNRRRDEFLVSIAGVTMNLLLAVGFSLLIRVLVSSEAAWLQGNIGTVLFEMLFYVVSVNLVLMVFNLIPVPPLDGFGLVTELFNLRRYSWYWKVYEYGFPILMILIIFDVTDFILTPAVSGMLNLLVNYVMF
ncbi:MAG: site-2 protease family protein [Firmicutes bacterium]|nr:site-2 protease family protein [Bacillota bacterium]